LFEVVAEGVDEEAVDRLETAADGAEDARLFAFGNGGGGGLYLLSNQLWLKPTGAAVLDAELISVVYP
jgi:hypothetical protein